MVISIFNSIEVPSYLVNSNYDDKYFDVIDAIEEAKHIYFNGNNLIERITERGPEPFIIGETGFGVGRIIVSLIDFLESNQLKNINIIYNSVELHPISSEQMFLILDNFKEKHELIINQLVEEYKKIDITKSGWQQLKINRSFGTITINLWLGEALEMVNSLDYLCDVWFLDGHSPKKNPSIWRAELLNAIVDKTVKGGTFSTFTVSVSVTKDLVNAGFSVEQFPSFARKRAVQRGIKN